MATRYRRPTCKATVLISVLGSIFFLWLYAAAKIVAYVVHEEPPPPQTGIASVVILSKSSTDLTVHDAHVQLLSQSRTTRSSSSLPGKREEINCTATADVRGNLGPPSVLLADNNGTDWIKDRWQAASDMHGTNIQGPHWVQLAWTQQVVVQRIVLDWEAAYADEYDVQVQTIYGDWETELSAPNPALIAVTQSGQSPGVKKTNKKKTPLHVVHNITLPMETIPTTAVRIFIRKSATGWGVSLWQVQMYGYHVV